MKKILSIALAAVLVFSLAATAFAVEGALEEPNKTGTGTATTADVTASYVAGGADEVPTAYYVNVSWTVTSTLQYTGGNTALVWNAEEMKYEAGTSQNAGGWSGEATVTVTVTNQSNAEITATAAWNKDTDAGADATMNFEAGATVTVGDASEGVTVAAGESRDGAAPVQTITGKITADDVTGAITASDAVLGNVTVTFAPAED